MSVMLTSDCFPLAWTGYLFTKESKKINDTLSLTAPDSGDIDLYLPMGNYQQVTKYRGHHKLTFIPPVSIIVFVLAWPLTHTIADLSPSPCLDEVKILPPQDI